MRDYTDLCARLDASSEHLAAEAADAIRELRKLADGMTSLGVDLEAQVADQLEADIFWYGDQEPWLGASLEDVMSEFPVGKTVLLGRAHTLPSKFARRQEDNSVLSWYAGDEPDGVL